MNKNILFVLALGWILAGCGSQTPWFGGSKVGSIALGLPGCTAHVAAACTGDENDPKVEIDLDTMTVDPECVKARKGKTITVTLKSASPIVKGSIDLYPKKLENFWWMARTNSPNKNKIKVRVPTKKKSGESLPVGEYNYGISTPTKCIDPRINVEN